jgi:hypothetical protein
MGGHSTAAALRRGRLAAADEADGPRRPADRALDLAGV